MYRKFKSRYAVKTSNQKYASIIATHRTLGEAYKTMIRHHREHYKNVDYVMAQPVIVIIATEASNEIIDADIKFWKELDHGPRSRQRLPLVIVVHQWNPRFNRYLRFGEHPDG